MFKRRQILYLSTLLATLPARPSSDVMQVAKAKPSLRVSSNHASLARKVHTLNNRQNQFAKSAGVQSIRSTLDTDTLCQQVFNKSEVAVLGEPYGSLLSSFLNKRIEDHNHLTYHIENDYLITESESALLHLATRLTRDGSELSTQKDV